TIARLSIEVTSMWLFRLRRTLHGLAEDGAGSRSYGKQTRTAKRSLRAMALAMACAAIMAPMGPADSSTNRINIVALGDSLTAGFGLRAEATFPARLEQALKAKGVAVEVVNAGVSGDTTSDGLARLDWAVPEGTDAVILALGANDMLRGIDPKITR